MICPDKCIVAGGRRVICDNCTELLRSSQVDQELAKTYNANFIVTPYQQYRSALMMLK